MKTKDSDIASPIGLDVELSLARQWAALPPAAITLLWQLAAQTAGRYGLSSVEIEETIGPREDPSLLDCLLLLLQPCLVTATLLPVQ